MGVIPKPFTGGEKWYQPYIHSVPENFLKARDAYYSGFTLTSAIATAKSKAENLFDSLEKFYENQELELASFLNISHSELVANLGNFLNNLTNMWQDKTQVGAKYGFMTSLPEQLNNIKKIDELIESPEYVQKSVNAFMTRKMSKIGKNVKSVSNARLKKSYQIITEFDGVVNAILKQQVADPNDIASRVVRNIMLGQPIPKNTTKEAKNIIKVFKEQNQGLVKLMTKLQSGLSPVTLKNKIKTEDVRSSLIRNLGFFNEDLYTEIINGLVAEGTSTISTSFMKKLKENKVALTAKQVGAADVKRQVQDVNIILTNKYNEKFTLGLDLKFTTQDATVYKRGKNKKSFNEIAGLIPEPLSGQMMYLLANSYYQKDAAKNTYDNLIGSDGNKELYTLINVVRGLYGLLPASAVDFTKIDRIEDFVKRDTRMYILVNNNIVAMTSFLEQVKPVVLKGEKADKSVVDLRKSLADILNKFDAK